MENLEKMITVHIMQEDAETIFSLMKTERDPIFAMEIIPYYALFIQSCQEYMGETFIEGTSAVKVKDIRNFIKIYGESFGKSKKRIELVDIDQDEQYRAQLRFDFMKSWNIHLNLGTYWTEDNHVVGNTQMLADFLEIDDIFNQKTRELQYELGSQMGAFVASIRDGFSQVIDPPEVKRLRIGVVTEVNMPLTILDYMALENAVITLQYSFMETYAKNEIEKKYQRDIEYSLLNGLLTGDELSKAAGMLKLKDTAQYCVVSFHTISSNSEDYYTKEELEEIGVIEGEIQRLLPDEHIYRNLNQIVCIHEIKPGETQAGFREEMEKLYQTVQKQIFHRNKTTDFQIGIGSIVNGYGDLKKSFKDSKKIIDYMDMLRYLYGDKNISVADFSKLGFFQIFEKIKNRDELMEYVPESLVKLYWYDKEHDGELIETLQAYLDCDKSANKAAEKLYVNYRTLSGRLKKIKDISGIDFKNSAEMLAVRNGIVLFKMAETL